MKPLRIGSGGGEGGIRTPDTLASMPHFECGAFNRSATSPGRTAGAMKPPEAEGAERNDVMAGVQGRSQAAVARVAAAPAPQP